MSMTAILHVIYTFYSIFGAIWPVMCWCAAKLTRTKPVLRKIGIVCRHTSQSLSVNEASKFLLMHVLSTVLIVLSWKMGLRSNDNVFLHIHNAKRNCTLLSAYWIVFSICVHSLQWTVNVKTCTGCDIRLLSYRTSRLSSVRLSRL